GAQRSHQGRRSTTPIDVGWARARCADEVNLLHQGPPRMLCSEEDDARHDEVEIGRTKGAWEAHFGALIVADRNEIDVARAVDLRAGQKEHVDAALACGIEELTSAVGK